MENYIKKLRVEENGVMVDKQIDYEALANLPALSTVATSGSYDDLTNVPIINGVALSGEKTSSDLKLGLVNSYGGFQAGLDASASTGGAVGCEANATAGGAIGYKAKAISGGGAVGSKASATNGGAVGGGAKETNGGGAVGVNASATLGGAVGYEASATSGGAIGYRAKATISGGAVGTYANATSGGAVGYYASATYGGAMGYEASATYGGAIGNGASATQGGSVGSEATSTFGGAVGYKANTTTGGAIGSGTSVGDGFAGGYQAKARYATDGITEISGAVAVGYNAVSQADDAVQLGTGTNTNANTLQFRDYQLVDSNGKIPGERLPEVDLSNYYTKLETDELLQNIAPKYCEEITYSQLKALRDNNELIPGMQYRIIDYVCTTSQPDTRAVQGTDFDIIVQALSKNILSENASVCAPSGNPVLMSSVLTNKVIKSHVVPYYYEYIDCDNGPGEGLTADYRQDKDIFVTYDYRENNEGVVVPVIYKTAIDGVDPTKADFDLDLADPDYADQYYYEGIAVVDGVTYDKWRLVNESDDAFNWDSTAKCYIYTNQIVDNDTIDLDSFLYEEETDEYRLDSSAVVLSYYEFIDSSQDYGLTPDSEKKFAAYEYLPDDQGNIVPVLHDWNPDDDGIGYNENYYYVGQATINGQVYDKWRKIELDATDEDDFGWDSPGKAYYYTNVIVERGVSALGNINFGAWEIKYCLDNDKTRFAWADEESGTGVIYYMKDEWDNECPYDFKNIMFKRSADWLSEHSHWSESVLQDTSNDRWFYTFTWVDENDEVQDLTLIGNTLLNDKQKISGVFGNKIGICSEFQVYLGENAVEALSYNVFVSSYFYGSGLFYGCYGNTLDINCAYNTFGDSSRNNTFGNGCYENLLGNAFTDNTFGNSCYYNTFGNDCHSNTFGNSCNDNSFGNYCHSNTFGNSCNDNSFGNSCSNNTFGNLCSDNNFGNYCNYNFFSNSCFGNYFGEYCDNNFFGADCSENSFSDTCVANTFGNDCEQNHFWEYSMCNTFGNLCRYNTFGFDCSFNTFGNKCDSNTFGNACGGNTFGNYCEENTLLSQYARYNIFENGVQSVTLTSETQGNWENYLQNITVSQGMHNKTINATRNADYQQIFRKSGSQEILVD